MSKIRIEGRKDWFDFLDPDNSPVDIQSIAWSLSMLCRYTGQVPKFYSVAEHSVLVSNLVPREFALQGLLHDAAEAFTGDVSKPLKALLPDFRTIEFEIERSIRPRLGIPQCLHFSVKDADTQMYRLEIQAFDLYREHMEINPSDYGVRFLEPPGAFRLFMNRYKELTA